MSILRSINLSFFKDDKFIWSYNDTALKDE